MGVSDLFTFQQFLWALCWFSCQLNPSVSLERNGPQILSGLALVIERLSVWLWELHRRVSLVERNQLVLAHTSAFGNPRKRCILFSAEPISDLFAHAREDSVDVSFGWGSIALCEAERVVLICVCMAALKLVLQGLMAQNLCTSRLHGAVSAVMPFKNRNSAHRCTASHVVDPDCVLSRGQLTLSILAELTEERIFERCAELLSATTSPLPVTEFLHSGFSDATVLWQVQFDVCVVVDITQVVPTGHFHLRVPSVGAFAPTFRF